MNKGKKLLIWITGLSDSGKTTLGNALEKALTDSVQVDGDVVRERSATKLDYSVESRIIQINRIRSKAKEHYDSGKVVIVSALYSNEVLLSKNREFFENYIEIYLKCSKKSLIDRDTKGIYSQYIQGKMKDVVGFDIPWSEPINSDFVFDTSIFPAIDDMVNSILAHPYLNNNHDNSIE